MRKRLFHIILVAFTALLLSACRVSRYVPEGKYFLDKNKIEIEGKDKVEFTESEVSSYTTQKPHKVRFPTKFSTWLYYVTEDNNGHGFKHWLNEHFSKKPVYFDASEIKKTTKQMEQYLDNRGYFHSKVTPKTEYSGYHAKVTYTIHPATPYIISKVSYQSEDTVLLRSLERLKNRLPVKEGEVYNAYNLDEQRSTVTNYLRNLGYYFFTRNYITFEVDSSFNNHTLEVTMKIAEEEDRNTGKTHPHKIYTINKISIYPSYRPSMANRQVVDSASITYNTGFRNQPNTLDFYYYEKPQVRPSTFSQMVTITKGSPFRQRQVELTYNALTNLKIFNNTSIEFDTVACDTANLLNCRITMRRGDTHSMKLQAEATNSGGDLGISGSITYTNKNIFRGAEVLTLSVKGGLETQEIINLGEANNGSRLFNTGEILLNTSIYFPKFLSPIPLKSFARDYQPRTMFNLGGSIQLRYAYSRYINTVSFGYDWKSNPRLQFVLSPIYINFVKVNPIPEFQELLDQETNQRIKEQYTNHFIIGGRYSVIYNTQNLSKTNNYIYIRGNLESSGLVASLFNKTSIMTVQDDHYNLFGIRYAQYVRGDIDFRQYFRLGEKTWFVSRQVIGVGIPYGNTYDMPFERSFFSGGSMGMRGWSYRKLGPGAYHPEVDDPNLERIGDIQLEVNAELRFPIHGIFNGAVFADAGNIWNYHANENFPNGEFHFDTFYNQIAIDAGIGLRLDFNIVILRLDWAFPLRFPYADETGSHWNFHDFKILDTHLVLNIGYPF